jgi:hypothetical protein
MSTRHPWLRRAVVLALAAGLAPLTAACGSSPGTTSSSSSSAVSAGLQFAVCVRAHGVPNYPDPGSNGQEPEGAKQIARSSPRFLAASQACAGTLPNGGQQSQASTTLDQANATQFAKCMRGHGQPNWPDATADSGGQLVFNVQASGIDSHSQQVLSQAHSCQVSLHLTQLPHLSS